MDPISDMLTHIRNAQAVGHLTVDFPFSKPKFSLAKLIEKYGFVSQVIRRGRKEKKKIEIILKYKDEKRKIPWIRSIKRISKPGKRIYVKAREIRPVLGGRGISVVSTSQGLMTGKEANKKGLGGEVVCEIW